MKKNDKNTTYINSVCAARSKNLVGKERLYRMAEAPNLSEAFDILCESGFGGGEKIFEFNDFAAMIKADEEELFDFVKEYAPDETIKNFCLVPRDFYNAEVLVKSAFMNISPDKFTGGEGIFGISYLDNAIKNEKYSELPSQLAMAVTESKKALSIGKGGMTIGGIFTNKKYEYLLSLAKNGYLKNILIKEIDGLNISVCLRSENREIANKMLIKCGSLTEKQTDALLTRDKDIILSEFLTSDYRQIVLTSLQEYLDGKPFIELERELFSVGAERMLSGRFVETVGTKPFMLYFYRRQNQIAAVRTILTGKANGLDKEEIKRRIITA